MHFLDRGVRYHLGDERLATTRDKAQVTVYPVVGTLWERDFTASRDDRVEVVLERLWGVDAAGGRVINVMLDGQLIGEINEGEEGPWRSALKAEVTAGGRHTLGIHTFGTPDPDDFVFEGVQVRSFNGAVIRPEGKVRISSPAPAPLPSPTPRPPATAKPAPVSRPGVLMEREAACGIYGDWTLWRPDTRKGTLVMSVGQGRQVSSDTLYRLPRGYKAQAWFRVRELTGDDSAHRMTVRVGEGPGQAWFFELEASGARKGGAALKASHLWGKSRDPLQIHRGWNQLTVHYCVEGLAWIKINDKVFPKAARADTKTKDLVVEVLGIELELSNKGG